MLTKINYCSHCAAPISFGPVPDDERPRYHCSQCKTIHYQNPNVIVGCLPYWNNEVLLCKRAIEPRAGKWTLPAGFLEMGEKVEAGAKRETKEEANAKVEIIQLFSVYNLPKVGQVYMMFLAELLDLDFHPGKESLEVKLFKETDIPWDTIAFSAVTFTLRQYFENSGATNGRVFLGTQSFY